MSTNTQQTCKHCRHWGAVYPELDKGRDDTKHCGAIGGTGGYGGNGAGVAGHDEEGIETDADFGCIHFAQVAELR